MKEIRKIGKHIAVVMAVMVVASAEVALADKSGTRPLSSSEVLRRFNGSPAKPFSSAKVLEILRGDSQEERQSSSKTMDTEGLERLRRYFVPTEEELLPLFEHVRRVNVVTSNPVYAEALSSTIFHYWADNYKINASSFSVYIDNRSNTEEGKFQRADAETTLRAKQDPERYQGPLNLVRVFGGEVRFAKIVALAFAAEENGANGVAKSLMKAMERRHFQSMDDENTAHLIQDVNLLHMFADEKVLDTANKISAGMLIGTIGHEAGHIALGHTRGPGYNDQPNEVSKNQERQADAFASAVIATSPYAEYILKGVLINYYIFAQKQIGGGDTHPYPKERFKNFVIQNRELAESLGITVEE